MSITTEPHVITVYGIPNCDTVRRARSWLASRGIQARWHDFRRDGLPAAALQRWLSVVGRERLVNRQGTTWRKLDDAQRSRADSDEGTQALLADQVSLIRRPVVEWADGSVTIGFDETDWARRVPVA
jgi:Spx/MgsR family transcriptional regulator